MIRARLIDLEGVTVANMALPDEPDHPRWYVEQAAAPKIAWAVIHDGPIELTVKRIEYRLERRDGGGTYIYRRTTGPWE